MTHPDLLTHLARARRDELLRQADARRLAAAVRPTEGRREAHVDPVRWRRRFAGSFGGRDAAPAGAGAREL
jgi:hypothetical protein